MKYSQSIAGLLAGTALGAAIISISPHLNGGAAPDKTAVEQIVRDVISNEPKLILESVQKFQDDQRNASLKGASEALKDSALHSQIFDDDAAAFIGPKDAKKVVVEYYDYNCPACKMQYKNLDEIVQKNKDIKIILKEYPIFGPVSETNSKLGLAIWHHYPEKYYAFHSKMLSNQGRSDEKTVLEFAKDLGIDAKKIQAYAASPEADAQLKATRAQGDKLNIQGTPTLIVGDEVIPHAMLYADIIKKLAVADASADTQKPADIDSPSDKK